MKKSGNSARHDGQPARQRSEKAKAPKIRRSIFEPLERRDAIGAMIPYFPGQSLLPNFADVKREKEDVSNYLRFLATHETAFQAPTAAQTMQVAPDDAAIELSAGALDNPRNASSGAFKPSREALDSTSVFDVVADSSELDAQFPPIIATSALLDLDAETFENDSDALGSLPSVALPETNQGVSFDQIAHSPVNYDASAPNAESKSSNLLGSQFPQNADPPAAADSSNAVADSDTPATSNVTKSVPKSDDSNVVYLEEDEAVEEAPVSVNYADASRWNSSEYGGSLENAGSVKFDQTGMTLYEGDSFVVEARRDLTIVKGATTLTFAYQANFDLSDSTSINDAFEVALVDSDGYTIVDAFSDNRDAYFNLTEGWEVAVGSQVTVGDTVGGFTEVVIDLTNVPDDMPATLVLRLVNNDDDAGSWVRIGATGAENVEFGEIPAIGGYEGASVSIAAPFTGSSSDVSVYSGSINWGDGTVSTGEVISSEGGLFLVGEHIYADNGSYAVNLSVDAGGKLAEAVTTAEIANVAPTLSPIQMSFDARLDAEGTGVNQSVVLTGAFTDPGFSSYLAGTEETFAVVVDWGDGTVETFVPKVEQGAEGRDTIGFFDARRRYAQGGIYEVTVTVRDDDGGEDSDRAKFAYGEIEICLPVVTELDSKFVNRPYWSSLSHGEIPVIVKSVGNFDATSLDVDSVRFYPGEAADFDGFAHNYDVDPFKDGVVDSIYHFSTWESAIRPTDKIGWMTATLADGTPFFGADAILATPLSGRIPDSFEGRTAADSGTRYFVLDSALNSTFRYTTEGAANGDYSMGVSSADPRDIAANADGSRVWTVDGQSRQVEVRSPDGWFMGSWKAEDVVSPEGVAADGTDVWIVDAGKSGILRYQGAASATQGTLKSDAFFPLAPTNVSPTGATTDGAVVWVSDDFADSIFAYDAQNGAYLGSFALDAANADSAGVTNDPTGASDSLWVVDAVDLTVYEYVSATTVFRGALTAAAAFTLTSGNAVPTGIADPYAGASEEGTESVSFSTISVAQPSAGENIDAGATILISGTASTDSRVVCVLVDGQAVDALDSAGNYFYQTQVLPGLNEYEITAIDANGATVVTSTTVWGVTDGDGTAEELLFEISPSFKPSYARTSFDARVDKLYAELAIENVGAYSALTPFYVGVTNISDPSVTVVDYAGVTKDGIAYYNISDLVSGATFDPNEVTAFSNVVFSNPERVQFDYDLVFVYQPNNAPRFVSVPETDGYLATDYVYKAQAVDSDGDDLAYSLVAAPEGMTINKYTGEIAWFPGADAVGTHTVVVRAEDGRGGASQQTYSLTVDELPPNRPPVITSFPVTEATIGATSPGAGQGNIEPEQIILTSRGVANERISLTLDNIAGGISSADVVFVVDESGSMSGEHEWLLDLIGDLNDEFEYAGITNSRYGLVGFESTPRAFSTSNGDIWMTPEEFSVAAKRLSTSRGGTEDGYYGIGYVLDNYEFRSDAVPVIVLVTDEDRDQANRNFTYNSVLEGVEEAGALLYATLNCSLSNASSETALGVDSWSNAFLPYGDSCIATDGGVCSWGDGTTIKDYVNLVWEAGGSVWDLNQLRKGGLIAQQFSATFVDNLRNDVVRRIPVAVSVDSDVEGFTNLTGTLDNRAPGEAVSFDIQIDGSVAPDYFFVNFENASTGEKLGSIPVFFSDRALYVYDVEATDPDRDELAYMLTEAPQGMTINPETGLIIWAADASQLGKHTVSVEVADGKGGIDSQTFIVEVLADPTNHAPVIISEPTTTVLASEDATLSELSYRDNVVAIDADGDNLTYSLLEGPEDMRIDSVTGALSWNAGVGDIGDHEVSVQVSDGRGGFDRQTFILHVLKSGGGTISGYVWNDVNQNKNWDPGTNLVQNFDFEQGRVDFESDLAYQSNLWSEGTYYIGSSPSDYHSWFESVGDHTTGSGKMLIVNGATLSNHSVWKQKVEVKSNSRYTFGVWATSVSYEGNTAELQFYVDGKMIGESLKVSEVCGDWRYLSASWVSGEATNAVVEIRNYTDAYGGNDFALDDIEFKNVEDGEIGLANHLVWLDQNRNGIFDSGERSTYTDANGYYVFSNLPEDTYYVRYQALNGWMQTFPTDGDWSAENNIVVNGSFENIADDGLSDIVDVFEPYDLITGWVVSAGSVTLHGTSWQESHSGQWSIDLQGLGTGSISQTLKTIPGQKYVVQYAVAGDLTAGYDGSAEPRVKRYSITAGDESIYQEFDVTGHTRQSMGWEIRSWSFTADETETVLTFSGLDDTWYGAMIDDVMVMPVAEELHAGGHTVLLYDNMSATNRNFGAYNAGGGSNNNPVITSTASNKAVYNELYRYDVKAFDADGDELTYELLVAPDGMTIHPDLGVVVWTPGSDQTGTSQAIVKVSDGRGGVATQVFAVTVEKPNNAPVITTESIPAQILAGSPFQTTISAQDADGDAIVFSLGADAPQGLAIDASSGVLSWTPGAADVSSTPYSVTVIATDARGAASSKTYFVEVVAELPNELPTISSTPRVRTRFDLPYVYVVEASDPNGDPLTYALAKAPKGMTIDPVSGVVAWTPDSSNVGVHNVEIVVSDGRGGVASQAFALSVVSSAENTAPQIVSNPVLIALLGKTYSYAPEAYDAEGDYVMWRLEEGPEGMSINPLTGDVVWTPTSEQRGANRVVLAAVDSYGASSRQTFEVTVRGQNRPPAIVSTPETTAYVDEAYVYVVQARDADGDVAEFSLLSAPDGMTIDAQTGMVLWTPTAGQVGKVSVSIMAKDEFGGLDVQRFNIEVVDKNLNYAPTIKSTPVYSATAGHSYSYAVSASDPENDPLAFSLVSAPSGMTIDAATGVVSWTTRTSDVGSYVVTVAATDLVADESGELREHATAYQTFTLLVRKNQAPTITSTPIKTATAGGNYVYAYDVMARDADGDALTYELLSGPDGMTIDSLGRLRWTPSLDDMGTSVDVSIRVSDGFGGIKEQNYSIQVEKDSVAPVVQLGASSNLASIGGTVDFTVLASDNVGVDSVALFVDGRETALTAVGQNAYKSVVTFEKTGLFDVYAQATDYAGNVSKTDVWQVSVYDESDSEYPVITVHSFVPQIYSDEQGKLVDGEAIEDDALWSTPTLTYLTDVVFSIDDENMANWRVEYAPVSSVKNGDGANFKLLASGSSSVDRERVRIDTTAMANDVYYLRFVASDVNGHSISSSLPFAVAGGAKLGQLTFSVNDIALSRNGISINITRTYDSFRADEEGDFGYGWTMSVCDPKIVESTPEGGEMQTGDRVVITTPDGNRVGFTYEPEIDENRGGLFDVIHFDSTYTPKFVADKGVNWTLSVREGSYSRGGIFGWIYESLGATWNPDYYILTSPEGVRYEYAQDGGLQLITDASGNQVTVTDDGLFHSAGGGVTFERDARGRIVKVTDNMGATVTYAYDKDGNLSTFSDQVDSKKGVATQIYKYLDVPAHFLSEIYDSEGVRVSKSEFDENGRFVAFVDAAGNVASQNYDLETLSMRSIDSNGNVTVYQYDEIGNVVQETTEGVINVLTGETESYMRFYEYADPSNPKLETRIIKHNGTVIEYTYREDGEKLSLARHSEDGLNAYVRLNYDDEGNVIQININDRQSLMYTYNEASFITSTVSNNGAVTYYEYNEEGKQTKTYNDSGSVSLYEYPDSCPCGTPSKTIFPDGTIEKQTWNRQSLITSQEYYDSEGHLVYSLYYEYDEKGRNTRITRGSEDESITFSFTYDGSTDRLRTEQVVCIQDESLNETTYYFYDVKGNLARQVDPGMNVEDSTSGTFFIYDNNNNLIWEMDPVGNVTTWKYDALNRVVAEYSPSYWYGVDWSDLTESEIRALLDSRYSLQEQNPYAPSFVAKNVYDSDSNLVETVDFEGQRITYSYNGFGDVVSEIWYDKDDDITPVKSIAYEYNNLNQMVRAVSEDAEYLLTYTDASLVESLAVKYPWAENFETFVLTYSYDVYGNVLETTDSFGVSQVYAYDGVGRITSTGWRGDGIVGGEITIDFSYDVLDRLTSITRWNDESRLSYAGSTEFSYKSQGSVEQITNYDCLDQVFSELKYEYDFAGRLIEEDSVYSGQNWSKKSNYLYDAYGQLISASYDNLTDDESFVWDANGNSVSSGSIVGVNNKIEEDESYYYSYDNNGNLVSKTKKNRVNGECGYTEYSYDHKNRIVEVLEFSKKNGVLLHEETYRYDMFGRRVSSKSDSLETIYVYNGLDVSTQNDEDSSVLSNEWARFDGNGQVIQRFLFSDITDFLFAQWTDDSGISWTLVDRLGSVRDLFQVKEEWKVVQHVEYSAFGVPSFVTLESSDTLLNHPYAFTGRVWDSVPKMYFYRARYFDPILGKFTSTDPLGFAGGDVNLYRYIHNNPVGGTDPSGMYSEYGVSAMALPGFASLGSAIVGLFDSIGATLAVVTLMAKAAEVTAEGIRKILLDLEQAMDEVRKNIKKNDKCKKDCSKAIPKLEVNWGHSHYNCIDVHIHVIARTLDIRTCRCVVQSKHGNNEFARTVCVNF